MGFKDKEKRNEYFREYRKKRKAAGLCIDCGKKAEKGKSRCSKHLNINNELSKDLCKKFREQRRKKKLCALCGNHSGESYLCPKCSPKQHMYSKRRRLNKSSMGICVQCRNPSVPGLKMCEFHLNKSREESRCVTKRRRSLGLCTRCGDKLGEFDADHTCSDCSERLYENRRNVL